MNRDQLLNAIGNVDESMIDEMEQLRRSAKVVTLPSQTENASPVAKKRSRRFVVCLVACLVLALGGIAYAAASLLSGGDLTVRDMPQDELDEIINNIGGVSMRWGDESAPADFPVPAVGVKIQYTVPQDLRIPYTSFTGDVLNCAAEFDEHNCSFLEDPDGGNYSHFSFDKKNLPSVDAGKQYIGYAGLKFPTVSLPQDDVSVEVYGTRTQNGETVNDEIRRIYLIACFNNSNQEIPDETYRGIYYLHTSASLRTENYPWGPEDVSAVDMSALFAEGAQVTSQTEDRIAANREFRVVTLTYTFPDEHSDGTTLPVCHRYVFWQENNVVYTLSIHYAPESTAVADSLISEWMNGFAD